MKKTHPMKVARGTARRARRVGAQAVTTPGSNPAPEVVKRDRLVRRAAGSLTVGRLVRFCEQEGLAT
jgi:hypothetical protein